MSTQDPSQAEGPGLDDRGQPRSWWARLLFQARPLQETEYRLGIAVVGLAVILACYVWWSVVPQMIANLGIGIVNGLSWIGTLFSGGGSQETVAPVLTPGPTVLPSPSPSPFASPSPSPALPR
ncbi:MAG: hypothetical protein IT306_14295 [Chloroflexi bacterium]|nr:hypothetical protein [Chloroflexota bacterium]